ncbi:ABC transporter permease [Fusobacterium necrophorum]|uniref:ABC transporter permease n=1 Tax=Fusobacterium necrophorum TaxID=859 RepID=A0A4Q2KUL4_9FUSO|nr:ABC transporter permease [Fusobacterium necrophorum]
MISATKQYSAVDSISMVLALLGVSMPVFWLGLMLVLLFSVKLGLLPSGGFSGFKSVILPALTLGVGSAAIVTRMTRSSMLEVIRQDYIRTARAKGVSEKTVINKHALKNALIPIITVVGLQFGHLLGGAVLTESVYSWPGVGRMMVDASMVLALLGVSMPVFWLGLMLVLLFSVKLGLLPSGGFSGFKSVILPALTLGVGSAAIVTRMTRSSMLEVIRQDYIRTARAKGVSEKTVINKHALKNALIPIITVVGLQFGHLLGGAVLTESVYSWPGVGRMMVDAIRQKDSPTVLAAVIFLAAAFSIVNLLVDILYAYVDPRIKSQYK